MQILRPVGRLEKCSTARHALGIYRSVIVTCRYKFEKSLPDLPELRDVLYLAVAHVIGCHAVLRCCIIGEHTESPAFGLIESIDLQHVVTVVQLAQLDHLVSQLEQIHDGTWSNLDQQPAWKVVMFQYPDCSTSGVFDIAFVFHHAIADGLSGAAFHKSLLQGLQHATIDHEDPKNVPQTVQVPEDTRLTSPLEALTSLPLSWSFLAGQVLREYGPRWLTGSPVTLWTGTRCKSLQELPFRSRLHRFSIPSSKVQGLLKAARREETTLTALLTGMFVVALAVILPTEEGFLGSTAYSMRRTCGTPLDAMVNQTSRFDTAYEKIMLDDIRASPEDPSQIPKVARHFQRDMKAEMSRCPRDNLVGLLPYVSDYRKMYQKKIGQARELTFEVSNLGVFDHTDPRGHDGSGNRPWSIEDIFFSQGAQVVGPALTLNCASIRNGSLNLILSWQDGVVPDSVVDELVSEYERSINRQLQSQ